MRPDVTRWLTWKYWKEEWLIPLVIALIFATLIRTFLVQPFKIPSTSMFPTLKVGDRIFVNKYLYGARVPLLNKQLPKVRSPRRGDIIVFVSTTDSDYPEPRDAYKKILGPVFFNKDKKYLQWYTPRFLVKRLIGLPGDNIEIKEGDIYINGELLEVPVVIRNFKYFNASDYGKEGQSVTVPADSYFVLGDNSANSIDSRFWGFVPEKNLTGKVILIWWPLNRIRIIN